MPKHTRNFIKTGERKSTDVEKFWMDYLVLDLKRPWFIVDQGCDWHSGKCRDQESAAKFSSILEQVRKSYAPVFEKDDFFIMKRQLD